MIQFPHTIERRVDFSQTDAAGLMHFSTYFIFMEAAEAAVFRELGLRLLESGPDGPVGFPRVDVQCRFRRPLYFDDVVRIEVRLEDLESSRLHWGFRFYAPTSEMCAKGSMTTVCVRRCADGSLEPLHLTPEVRSALSAWKSSAGENAAMDKSPLS